MATVPGIDGLRALAIALVVGYHIGAPWLRGGYVGVDVFFVISGYLITGMLTAERRATGGIGLRSFWARRARRLLPALVALLAVLVVLSMLYPTMVLRTQLPYDALATLFYVQNWHLLWAGAVPYFDGFNPSPLTHTWSLSIEEQFYVLWPLALLALTARRGARSGERRLVVATVLGIVASAGAMAAGAAAGWSVDALYYDTGTRAFELLVGALLALLVPLAGAGVGTARRAPHVPRWLPPVAGTLGLVGVVAFAVEAGGAPTWVFEGGILAACAAAAGLVLCTVAAPAAAVSRLASLGPVRYLGRISYSLYLWHWPVILFLNPTRLHASETVTNVARLAVMAAASVASYHLVERPLRRRSYRALLPRLSLAAVGASLGAALFTVGALAPAVAAVGPPPAFAALARPGTDPAPVVATARRPLRVLYVGDSVMEQASIAIAAALGSTGVVRTAGNLAVPGWGLTSSDAWTLFVPLAVYLKHADVVVATWTTDDTWLLESDPHHTYPILLQRFVDVALRPAPRRRGASLVVFLEPPPLGPATSPAAQLHLPGYTAAGRARWIADVRALAAADPAHVLYLPVAYSLEQDGRYRTWLPDAHGVWRRVRQLDQFHLCAAGAARYAEAVLVGLQPALGLPAAQGHWWDGPWSTDTRFDHIPGGQPPGQCPSDASLHTSET